VSTEWANFLFEALNVGILAVALAWLVLKPIRHALDAEREKRRKAEAEIEERLAAAARKEEEVRQAQGALEAEIETHRKEMLAEAKAEAAKVVHAAREEAEAERRVVKSEIEQARLAQATAAAAAVGEVAGSSVWRLLQTIEGPPLDDALVRAACKELAGLDSSDLGEVTVEAARELSPASRKALADALKREFGTRVLPELGAGVRVTTAAGQVDATAEALSRDAGREVTKALREGRARG